MSHVGKKPISHPPGVEFLVQEDHVTLTGPRGTLTQWVNPEMTVQLQDGWITVTRPSDKRRHRAIHGLTRSLIANMVTGVTEGFQKSLELVGVGNRVQQSGDGITLQVGYSHNVEIRPLQGTTLEVEGNNRVHVKGIDKQQVGELAARIRKVRRPNAYTGKGIRYLGEAIRLKPGKSAGRK